MKNLAKTVLLHLTILFAATPIFAQTETEEAIKKVCTAETQAWLDGDFEAWTATHSHEPNEVITYTSSADGSIGTLNGWETIQSALKAVIATGQNRATKLNCDHFKFIIRGETAFVNYTQILTEPDGKTQKSFEHRLLHLVSGQWKISAVMAFHEKAEGKK